MKYMLIEINNQRGVAGSRRTLNEFKPATKGLPRIRSNLLFLAMSISKLLGPLHGYARAAVRGSLYSTPTNHLPAFLSFDLVTAEPAFQCSFNPLQGALPTYLKPLNQSPGLCSDSLTILTALQAAQSLTSCDRHISQL